MNKFAPLHPKVSTLLHGADYNPSNGRMTPILLIKTLP